MPTLLRATSMALLSAASAGTQAATVDDAHSLSPLITACQACHGKEGASVTPDIPNLAGQKQLYLVHQLQAFRKGDRKNDLMAAIAAQLSDADIETLAANWSRMAPPNDASAAPVAAVIHSRMNFPAGFPKGFVLYETTADEESGHVIKRYANDAATKAARDGKSLPDGSALVTVNHELVRDATGKPALDDKGRPAAGKLLSYAAMQTQAGWGDAVPQLLRNGDWDYALFGADGTRRDSLNEAACLACHKPVAAESYVFTLKTLREAVTKN